MDVDSIMQSTSSPPDAMTGEGTVASSRLPAPTFSSSLDDISSQDLMDVDAHVSLQASDAATASGLLHSSSPEGVRRGRSSRFSCALQTSRKKLPTPGAMYQVTGVAPVSPFNSNFLLHAASVASRCPREDAAGAVGMCPVPTPPVIVVTRSDVASWP